MKTITLGGIDPVGDLVETGRLIRPDGVNWKPEFTRKPKAYAMVWLNTGTDEDLAKAKEYAKANGFEVFVFPVDEKDPLGKTREQLMPKKTSIA